MLNPPVGELHFTTILYGVCCPDGMLNMFELTRLKDNSEDLTTGTGFGWMIIRRTFFLRSNIAYIRPKEPKKKMRRIIIQPKWSFDHGSD